MCNPIRLTLFTGMLMIFHLSVLNAQSRSADFIDTRSDSIDILHYTIELNLLEDQQGIIRASTEIRFKALVDLIDHITLDLKSLSVDSVYLNNQKVGFTQIGEKLRTNFNEEMDAGDETTIRIWYGGKPYFNLQDFGRFYITGGYAFNIGVSFIEDPHNFGRAWFPCFDNFIERSTYTCKITTRPDVIGYGGGTLIADTLLDDRRIRTWEISQQIPTYLASAAAAPFVEIRDTFQSVSNNKIPVILAAVAADTSMMKSSFVNLKTVFDLFEAHFGAYRWDRVGYVMVPFSAGAMEHAMNIAFPRILLPYGPDECTSIMGHELAHHWFGNLVTCQTASEMWLNEGFSRYTEFLMNEWMYGRTKYNNAVRNNHRELLLYNHIRNGGYYPLSQVPSNYTYSESTYELPADIIHNLRTYTGDSLFFAGLKHYLQKHAFSHVNSESLREAFKETGCLYMDDFFNDWVFTAGWPHFTVEETKNIGNGNYRVFFSQKSTGNNHSYSNVPFTISFRFANAPMIEKSIRISGKIDSADFILPEAPLMVYLNRDEKISYAVTAEERTINSTGNVNWPNAFVDIDTRTLNDSAFLRVEHHWAAPDSIKASGSVYKLSPNRYWKVYSPMSEGFYAKAKFVYNGRKPTPIGSYGSGWLDTGFTYDERKLVLLYRKGTSDDWKPVAASQNMFASDKDMFGNFIVDTLRAGEYTFAETDSARSVAEYTENLRIEIFPNPANKQFRIIIPETLRNLPFYTIELLDIQGKILKKIQLAAGNKSFLVDVSDLHEGLYFVRLLGLERTVYSNRLIISE